MGFVSGGPMGWKRMCALVFVEWLEAVQLVHGLKEHD